MILPAFEAMEGVAHELNQSMGDIVGDHEVSGLTNNADFEEYVENMPFRAAGSPLGIFVHESHVLRMLVAQDPLEDLPTVELRPIVSNGGNGKGGGTGKGGADGSSGAGGAGGSCGAGCAELVRFHLDACFNQWWIVWENLLLGQPLDQERRPNYFRSHCPNKNHFGNRRPVHVGRQFSKNVLFGNQLAKQFGWRSL